VVKVVFMGYKKYKSIFFKEGPASRGGLVPSTGFRAKAEEIGDLLKLGPASRGCFDPSVDG
jgi:hypothetical protein